MTTVCANPMATLDFTTGGATLQVDRYGEVVVAPVLVPLGGRLAFLGDSHLELQRKKGNLQDGAVQPVCCRVRSRPRSTAF